jgi:ATP-dependent RNA helicase RhlE
MAFQNLNLIEPILKALAKEGYTTPTPIQQQAIPLALNGHDVLGCAQTGTGKTAAFSIPIIQLLALQKQRKPGIKALILTPTRELAIQIDESIAAYGTFAHIRHTVIFGGVSQLHQTNALKRGVDILVATPGRLLDLINQRFIDLRQLEFFVLDEADRMLDMGFIHDVKKIIALLPQKRQTMFFSATMPPEIQKLADTLLRNPKMVEVTPPATTVEKPRALRDER